MTYLTADQIAAGTGLAIGSVYRLAHLHRWRRTRTKPRGYLREDVMRWIETLSTVLDKPQPTAKNPK